MTNLETFSTFVDKRSHDECWPWLGPKDKYGRGLFRGMLAHEFCWVAFFGQIPEGAIILHRCGDVGCVNPYHLYTAETGFESIAEGETTTLMDYKLTRPGSHEWKDFWQQHPELQEEMLEWRKTENEGT